MAANDGFIDYLSPTALAELKEGNAEVSKAIALIDKFNSKLSGAKTPSSSNSAINELKNSVVDTEKAVSKLQATYLKASQQQQAAAERTRLAEIKLAQAREQAVDKYSAKEAKAAADAVKASEKIIAQKEREFRQFEKEFNKYEADLKRKEIAEERANQKSLRNKEKEILAERKLQKQREDSVDKFNRNAAKEAAALARSETYYNRIQNSVSLLTKTYQDLALRKQLGSTLTANEERQLASLTTRINLYQTALKKVDADVQKHQRNVGNYASSYNGLGNAFAQLGREAPAFANSLQTGFMALSNNLPILFDEIARTKQGIAALKAEGKDAPSLFSQIAKSVFSLQTLLSVGVLLLTIYGDELVEWIGNLIKGSKAADTFAESQKAIAEATKEGTKNAQQELVALRANLEIARDVNLSYKDRMIAVENLQKTYPYYFENLTKEKILAGETAAAENALTEAILSRAKANAAIGKITENQGKIIDLEEKRVAVQERLAKAQKAVNDLAGQETIGGRVDQQYDLQSSAANRLIRAQEELADINKEINEITAVNNRLTAYSLDQQKTAIGLDYNQDSATKAAKAKREDLEAVVVETNLRIGLIERVREQIAAIQRLQEANSESYEEFQSYQKIIDELNRQLKNITNGYDEVRESAERGILTAEEQNRVYIEQEERIKALRKATDDYIASIANSSLGDFGMGSLQQFFDGTFDRLFEGADPLIEKFAVTFQAITEVAEEAFGFINDIQQRQFDQQHARLEQQKNIQILFAGESATAREEIERQYEERRKAIARQQAEAQKKQAVFNILINTAQGVVAALAQGPTGIPLSVTIGILGAIQAGIVASTPIPQFYKGTENAPGGYAWVDERGPELHTDRHGNVKSFGSSKANLRLLESGDIVKTAGETKDIINRNKVIFSSGIQQQTQPVSPGISKSDIKELLNGIPTADNITLIDNYNERGYNRYKREKGQTTQLMNGNLRLVNRTLKRG